MIVNNNRIQIGSQVRILEDVEMHHKTYLAGHEFTVVSSSEGMPWRGWNLQDKDGNKLDETAMIKMELV